MAETGISHGNRPMSGARKRRAPFTRAFFGDILQFIDFMLLICISVAVAFIYHEFALRSGFDFQKYTAAGIVGATGLTAPQFAWELLDGHGVALLPGEGFGPSATGHVRLSLSAHDDELEEACARIEAFAAAIPARAAAR